MSKSTRNMIAERRLIAKRRKRNKIAITVILILALGSAYFFTIQDRAKTAQKYAEIDPKKSKGNPDASVVVTEYGDFQ